MAIVEKIANFAFLMTTAKYIGFAVLALLWAWLSIDLMLLGGFNLKNIIVSGASGAVIFIPLYRRYLSSETKSTNSKDDKR